MTNQIPENWLEQIDKSDYQEALVHEAEEMILALSVYFNINKPNQDNVIIALSSRWKKSVDEIVDILSAIVKFKAKVSLFDCFYGDQFHHDIDEKLVLTPDVVDMIFGHSNHEDFNLIAKARKDMTEASLYIEWMDIRFEYLS